VYFKSSASSFDEQARADEKNFEEQANSSRRGEMPTRKEQANSSISTRKEARSPLFQSRLCSSCICRMSAPEEQDSGVKLGTCCADHAI